MEETDSQSPKPETPASTRRGRKRKDTTDSSENTPQQAEARKKLRPRRSRDVSFPKTLEGFKVKFNDDGELRHIESGDKFDIGPLEDDETNQKQFEALAEAISDHVYEVLEKECELEKQTIPVEPRKSDAEGFIFTSSDALTNEDKLLILIHGTETSKAGQWSTKQIVEDGLNSGSQIPYIKKAKELGYGIIVMNPNQNSVLSGKWNTPKSIRGSENPDKHVDYVWKNFVRDAKAKRIAIIAYSQGGASVLKLAVGNSDDFTKRVFALALADSSHQMTKSSLKKPAKTHLVKVGRNFVPSDENEFGEEIPGGRAIDINMISAGDIESPQTCSKCMDSIFEFVSKRYEESDAEPEEAEVEESPRAKSKRSPRKKKSKVPEPEEEDEKEEEEEEKQEEKVEEKEEEKEEEEEEQEGAKEEQVEDKKEEDTTEADEKMEEEENVDEEKEAEEEKKDEEEEVKNEEAKEETKENDLAPEENDSKATENQTSNSEEKQEEKEEEKMQVDEVENKEEDVTETKVNGIEEEKPANELPKEKTAEKMEVQESQDLKPAEPQAV